MGNGQSLRISHIGSISSLIASHLLKMSNVLLVPHITKNLFSISKSTHENNCLVTFSSSGFTIFLIVAMRVSCPVFLNVLLMDLLLFGMHD